MQTIDELNAQRASRDEKAWRFQQVRDALFKARQTVEDLTPKVDAARGVLKLLEQVEETAANLPPDVVGQGGMRARDQIFSACAHAKKQTSNRIRRDQVALDKAVEDVPRLEAQLLALESSTT